MTTWFEQLTGIKETATGDTQQVRDQLALSAPDADDPSSSNNDDGFTITSRVNGRSWNAGRLELPSLKELRDRVAVLKTKNEIGGQPDHRKKKNIISLRIVAGVDVSELHADPKNAHALFQAASQFNLLEMASPNNTPEIGIGCYERDHTQGPACAIAAGAGTIYRNYFVNVEASTADSCRQQLGQSQEAQIDCLKDLEAALQEMNCNSEEESLWTMCNGYCMPSLKQAKSIEALLKATEEADLDRLRQSLRVGIQWNTQVTLPGCSHLVSQVYCSAIPCGYVRYSGEILKPFAKIILEATYEAAICAGILNAMKHSDTTFPSSNIIYLTLVGGGVFENELSWICSAIDRAMTRYSSWGLDIVIVSYSPSVDPLIVNLARKWAIS